VKPVGVRLHRADGTVLNCELADEGVDDEGMHNWRIANAVYRPGDSITVEELPPMTGVGFTAPRLLHGGALKGLDIEWDEPSGEHRQASVEVQYEKMWQRPDDR
jgi:hypothetical protein